MELDMLVAVALKHWLLYVKLTKLVACFVMVSFVSIQVRCLWDLQKLSSWMRSLLAWTVLPLTRLWSACTSQCMFWMELWLSLFSSQHQRHMHSSMISSYSQKVSLFIKVRVTWCLSSLRPWASGVQQGKGLLTSCKRYVGNPLSKVISVLPFPLQHLCKMSGRRASHSFEIPIILHTRS